MNTKEVKTGAAAKAKLLEGVNLVAGPVAATLGPKGRNAILSRDVAPPIITNDGVSIAAWFTKVSDPFVNTGVQMIKEVSSKQNGPGDGTTTATVLAAALVNEGVRHLNSGHDPVELKEGMVRASREALDTLKTIATPVDGDLARLKQVATISVEDEETGALIGELMHQVGKDGAITVETVKDVKLEKDMTDGLKFDSGWLTPYFMTNPFRQESVLEDVPVLVTNHTLSDNAQIVPLADKLAAKGIKGLVIICQHAKGEALNTMVNNHVKGIFAFSVIRLPGLDDLQTFIGQDIATAVGATFIESELTKLQDVEPDDLGSAERVITKQESTVIVKGGGTKDDVAQRIKQLKSEVKEAVSDFDRDQLKERIARLSGGIGVVRIGAATEQELTYKKHKIEDALAATRAAVEEGIVAGGGVTMLRLGQKGIRTGETSLGAQVFYQALSRPLSTIVENAGKNAETIIDRISIEGEPYSKGWDARTGTYVDMLDAGIIDPVKVTRSAIENAVSMASMFLTTESLIVDVPEEDTREQRLRREKGLE